MDLVQPGVRHLRVIAMALLAGTLAACANEVLLTPLNWSGSRQKITVVSNLLYGDEARQRLDIYRPVNAQKAPVMLFWYGGSWQHGAKDYYGFVGSELARQGFVAVLPDYRLAPDHPFPAFVEDAALAVRWARDHAAEFGGDPARIYISGHSAGGHNALMLALDPSYLQAVGMEPSEITGVVSLAAPTGLEHLRGPDLKGAFPMDVPDGAFSPIALAACNAGEAPPFLLMTGLDDDVIYPGSVAKLADAIRTAGGKVTIKAYPDVGHLGLLLDLSDLVEPRSKVAADMARFAGL